MASLVVVVTKPNVRLARLVLAPPTLAKPSVLANPVTTSTVARPTPPPATRALPVTRAALVLQVALRAPSTRTHLPAEPAKPALLVTSPTLALALANPNARLVAT